MKKIAAFLIAAVSISAAVWAGASKIPAKIMTYDMGKYKEAELGSGKLRIKKMLKGDLEVKDFQVMMYPRRGIVGLCYKPAFGKERMLMDAQARKVIRDAYDQYLQDYSEKKLDRKRTKFVKCYGVARTMVEWGPMQYSAYADPRLEIGYMFVGKSPYFVLKLCHCDSDQKKGDVAIKYAGMYLYFTRDQMKDFIDAIQEDVISLAIENQKMASFEASKGDSYDDADADYSEAADEESSSDKKHAKKGKKSEQPVENETVDYEEE